MNFINMINIGLAFFVLALLRSLLRIRHEGIFKPLLILSIGLASWWLARTFPFGPLWLAALGAVSLWFLARPSQYVRLTKRVQAMVSHITEGLGLEIMVGVIPIECLREDLASNGLDVSMAKQIINAFAWTQDNSAMILFTPGASLLADSELAFIAAHEVGHHVLGHTQATLFNKIEKFFFSDAGQLMTLGIGMLWKHLVVPRRSQSQEYAADAWAVSRLQELNLDDSGSIQVMNRFIKIESQSFLAKLHTKLFGDHPSAIDRRNRILKQLH